MQISSSSLGGGGSSLSSSSSSLSSSSGCPLLPLLDVPDLCEEGRQLPVDHAELEAGLGVGVAEGAELGEDGEQLGEADRLLLLALRHHVRLQRLHVDLLDLLHPLRLPHVVPVAEYDDGGDEGVLCVVDLHLAHVPAEAEEGLVGEA